MANPAGGSKYLNYLSVDSHAPVPKTTARATRKKHENKTSEIVEEIIEDEDTSGDESLRSSGSSFEDASDAKSSSVHSESSLTSELSRHSETSLDSNRCIDPQVAVDSDSVDEVVSDTNELIAINNPSDTNVSIVHEDCQSENDDANTPDIGDVNSISSSDNSLYDSEHSRENDFNSERSSDSEFSVISVDNEKVEYFSTKLKNNSGVSYGEMYFLIFSLYLRFQFTEIALMSIISIVNFAIGENVLPTSKHLFEKEFLTLMPMCDIHVLCEKCHSNVGKCSYPRKKDSECKGICKICLKPYNSSKLATGNFYITIPIASQLKSMYESQSVNTTIKNNIDKELNQPLDCVTSTMNAKIVCSLMTNPEQISFEKASVTVNTDGVNIHDSNGLSMWPLYFSLDQLPTGHKICLAGVWFGKGSPNMNQFLDSFAAEISTLATEGLKWIDPNTGDKKNTKIFISGLTADSPAKAKVLNIKSCSGYNPCSKCRIPGQLVKIKNKKRVRYPTGRVHKIRSYAKVKRDMKRAYHYNKHNSTLKKIDVNGFFGPSILTNVPNFHIPNSICIDSMHSIDLGMTRKLFFLWAESVGLEYYLGSKKMKELDQRILQIKRSSNASRDSRSIFDSKIYKATEWSLWLLFDSFAVLHKMLPNKYLKNLSYLSHAVYLLSKSCVTQEDIYSANELINKFMNDFEILYGKEYCVYNFHLLSHIVQDVIDFGPLWSHSCEVYESANSDLGKLVTGPAHIPQQVAKKYLMFNALQPFLDTYNIQLSNDCKELAKDLLPSVQRKSVCKIGLVTGLGNGTRKIFTPVEKQAMVDSELDHNLFSFSFSRVLVSGVVVTSIDYSCDKKRCDSYIKLTNGNYYQITAIIKHNDNSSFQFLTRQLILENTPDHFPPHIRKIALVSEVVTVQNANCFKEKLYFINVGKNKYFSCFPSAFKCN